MKTKIIAIVVGLVASIGLYSSENFSGTCGANLTWELNTSSGMLIISGSGDMDNWSYSTYVPWYNYYAIITSVSLPDGLTSIGNVAFSYCSGLTSIEIPNSVTSIGMGAFYNCTGLTSVTIPNSVTNIGNSAFADCRGLISVTIPNSVTSIGEYAFSWCSSLTSVTIPNSVTSIGRNAFYYVPNITYSGSATGSPWGARSVNGFVDGYIVYSDNSKTTLLACSSAVQGEVSIPNSVTSIGQSAFCECRGLSSVTIPSGITTINYNTFQRCTKLSSVTIPNSVTCIKSGAFSYCTSLLSVTIPNSVTSIDYDAFENVPNIIYSGSATDSPWKAKCINGFVDGYFVYSDNSKTTLLACSSAAQGEVSVPNSVTSIGNNAFCACDSLTAVLFDNNVRNIGSYAFKECRNITSINFHEQITNVGAAPFFDSGIKYPIYNSQIFAHIPRSDTSSYSIPEGITIIADRVFDQCQLSSLTIPSSVTSMPNIGGPCRMRTIICKVVVPPQLEFFFYSEGFLGAFTVYVPDESVQAYKNAKLWQLCNILPMSALPQSLENPSVTEEKSIKVMENGHIYIKRGDKTYTITGAEL